MVLVAACGDGCLQLFLNEGPIAFLVTVFFASWMLSQPGGLKRSVRLAAILCLSGSMIRCVSLMHSGISAQFRVLSVHIGQTLNAAAAPFVVVSVSQLSLLWFSTAERVTATAVANVASATGRAIGYAGPWLVPDSVEMWKILLLEAILAALPMAAVLLHFPAAPQAPTSTAAVPTWALERGTVPCSCPECITYGGKLELITDLWPSMKQMSSDIVNALSDKSFFLLALAGGLNMGIYGMWSGVLISVLKGDGGVDSKSAGMYGMANTFAGIVGGIAAGLITDVPSLRRRLKEVVVAAMTLAAVCFGVFAFHFPPLSMEAFRSVSSGGLLAICIAGGFFRGMADPIFFELAAELTHPKPAGYAGSVLSVVYHATLVATLSTPPNDLQKFALMGMAAACLTVAIIMLFVTIRYKTR